MDAIERAAFLSVGRACGFGGLAILCMVVGFSYDPVLAARLGGLGTLLMTGTLLTKSALAARTPYKHTETWLLLAEPDRPRPEAAQALIAGILRRAFLYYAKLSALVAAVMFGSALLLSLTMD